MTPCVNGYCVDGFNTYMCICDDGYTGRNCDEEGWLKLYSLAFAVNFTQYYF
jgi:hypothetical protein